MMDEKLGHQLSLDELNENNTTVLRSRRHCSSTAYSKTNSRTFSDVVKCTKYHFYFLYYWYYTSVFSFMAETLLHPWTTSKLQ
jgi:hypothetical protein